MNIENLTKEQLYEVINNIKNKFKDSIILSKYQFEDLRSIHQLNWSSLKDNYPTINFMKDDEILTAILNNSLIITINPQFSVLHLEDYTIIDYIKTTKIGQFKRKINI